MELILDAGRPRKMAFSGDVASLIKKLGLMREEVLVRVNGRIVPETRAVGPKDRVEIIKVVFGG